MVVQSMSILFDMTQVGMGNELQVLVVESMYENQDLQHQVDEMIFKRKT